MLKGPARWLLLPVWIWQRTLHVLARLLPGATTLRPLLHRARGVKIHGRVFIGANVYIDDAYPQNVTIHEHAVISIGSIIIAHFRGPGRVEIGREAFIGPHCVIMPDVQIGEGAVVAAGSVVNRDVAPHTMVGGVPDAKPMARATQSLGLDRSREAFQRGLRPLRAAARTGRDAQPGESR
jgi:serine acetyltransferase